MDKKMRMFFILFLITTFLMGLYLYVSWYFDKYAQPEKKTKLSPENSNKDIHQTSFEKNMNTNYLNTDTNASREYKKTCPKLLIRRGYKLYLYENTIEDIPLVFDSMDDYTRYLEKQRPNGVECPVLFLQYENNSQGQDVYRIRSDPTDLNSGFNMSNRPSDYGLMPYKESFDASKNQVDASGVSPPLGTKSNPITVKDANREVPPYNANQYNGFDSHGQYMGQYTNVDQIHDSTSKPMISENPMDDNWGGVLYTQQAVDSGKYDENLVYRPNTYTPANGQFYPFVVNNNIVPNAQTMPK